MKKKKKSSKTEDEDKQFQYNLVQVEQCSMSFLLLGCQFYDIYQSVKKEMQTDLETKSPLDKKIRRKSIQSVIRKSIKLPPNPKRLNFKKNSIFEEDKGDARNISFMIEDEGRSSGHSFSNFIKEGLGNEDLDQTIAFMSSEDEVDEHEIKGFAQQINSEFLRKDLYEIWKDFNEIAILLFSKNLKDCVISYRESQVKFLNEHFKAKTMQSETRTATTTSTAQDYNTEFSNRILSESMNLGNANFMRMTTLEKPGKETQINRELAEMYRNQHAQKKDRWIEYLFWGFLGSSVLILILFFVLFYCNVFSSND